MNNTSYSYSHTAHRQTVAVRPPGTTSRIRRRGPRSIEAFHRRSFAWISSKSSPNSSCTSTQHLDKTSSPLSSSEPDSQHLSPDDGPGQAGPQSSVFSSQFIIDHINIRGFVGKRAELEARLKLSSITPDLIALNETFLHRAVERISLTGYTLVSRLDRRDNSEYGGIALFARANIALYVIFLEDSGLDERFWHSRT